MSVSPPDVGEQQDPGKFITGSTVKSIFGVSSSTLRGWANSGKVAVVRFGVSDKRLYKKSDIEAMFKGYAPKNLQAKEIVALARRKTRIIYARVSSPQQKGDLERQIEALQAAYPDHEIVKDVASGVNWKRPGLVSILDRALRGDVEEVVVARRDRLCRFAFELVEHVLESSGCKVVVHNQGDEPSSFEAELRDDLLAIVTVFVASNNGRRAAANRRARRAREAVTKNDEENQTGGRAAEADQMSEVDHSSDAGPATDSQTMV